jgi:hypothetical protein
MPFGIHGKKSRDKSSIHVYSCTSILFHARRSIRRPWMVALFRNPRHGWSCAGVLVNENTILTAAHCVLHVNAGEMKAIIGVHTLWGKLNPMNYYSIKSIHRHPNYENCCQNDLAVIKLTKSVLYGPKINSVCLPFQPYLSRDNAQQQLINRTGIIIGWGDSSHNGFTNMIKSFTLQQGELNQWKNIGAIDSISMQ